MSSNLTASASTQNQSASQPLTPLWFLLLLDQCRYGRTSWVFTEQVTGFDGHSKSF